VLSVAEREEISRGVAVGPSVRQIAGRLGRVPSTVGRERGRHGGRACYRAATADAMDICVTRPSPDARSRARWAWALGSSRLQSSRS